MKRSLNFNQAKKVLDWVLTVTRIAQVYEYAGQGVVQFGYYKRKKRHVQVAVKFFLNDEDFQEEAKMYDNYSEDLRPFMPRKFLAQGNENGEIRDAFGNALPPHIVLERGDLLPALAAHVDVLASAKVCSHCFCFSHGNHSYVSSYVLFLFFVHLFFVLFQWMSMLFMFQVSKTGTLPECWSDCIIVSAFSMSLNS